MNIWNRIVRFFEKETVLSIATILAVISMLWIPPNKAYVEYIDVRTLAILFCLMAIVAGLKEQGIFDWMAHGLLRHVSGMGAIATILVMLCFVCSMFITNDVALITFVPLAIIIMEQIPETIRTRWMLRIVVMQTIAANLGSMLTPIGNPQNLYLYGQSGMGIRQFVALMLPYSLLALSLLVVWIVAAVICEKLEITKYQEKSVGTEGIREQTGAHAKQSAHPKEGLLNVSPKLGVYAVLFAISLLTVGRLVPCELLFLVVVVYLLIRDRKIFRRVDYSLLGTFVALFIFIGNLGNIPVIHGFLNQVIDGREVYTAIAASQVMSNVPAALLLSGFTDQTAQLVIGTNLGGLGTLIASMASLISFKYIAKEDRSLRLRYFIKFTAANLVFLAIMLGAYTSNWLGILR